MSDEADTELDQAKKEIKNAADVVELLVVLLKICRRHASEVMAAGQDRKKRQQIFQEVTRAEKDAIKAFKSRGLTDKDRELVIGELERAADLAVTARAWALGIDLAMRKQPKMYNLLCVKPPKTERVLKEDDPFPILPIDLPPMYGGPGGFSRRPRRSAATAFDRVEGLALWPSASSQPLRVIYDKRAGFYLDRALTERDTVNILAVVPNQDFWSEFGIDQTPPGLFFGVHPKNEVAQEAIIEDALQWASDHDVDIVVTPELSSTPKTVKLIRGWLDGNDRDRPKVVIAGGLHIARERRNRMSTIYADRKLPVITHDKIGEFVFASKEGDREEDIERSTELRIHAGNSWSMVTLICADFLDDAVVDAVVDLCPRLVIVPSMSAKTGDYEMSMGAVIRRSQALVMVVNGPHEWSSGPGQPTEVWAPVVVIGMPLASSWITRMIPVPPEAAPYKVLFRSDERKAEFV